MKLLHRTQLRSSRLSAFAVAAALAGSICAANPSAARAAEDLRKYMHGIEAVSNDDGGYWVLFSAAGLPPAGPLPDGSWTHDVYSAAWSAGDRELNPSVFISAPEAQEPVSAARTKDGHIMVTFEDGYNTKNLVAQRYGVYDPSLGPIKPYPNDVKDGGHSGHVAATDSNFVVFYSDDWIDGGGVDNLGTGNGVYAAVYDSNGNSPRTVRVAPDAREWWPMLAASPAKAILIWQKYVPGQVYANLRMAILDPAQGRLTVAPRTLRSGIQYYVYQAAYVPALDEFLVTGAVYGGAGFAYLIDTGGAVTASLANLPATVREGRITVDGKMAYLAAADNRLLRLALTGKTITLNAAKPSPIAWSYLGDLGLMRAPSKVHWLSLNRAGLLEADFDFSDIPPYPAP